MTMVWNITSHNDRAIAIESAKFSNTLASEASRTAFLIEVLAQGVSRERVPRLVKSAQEFIEQLRSISATSKSVRKQPFRSLIPMRVVEEAVHPAGADELADAVERALHEINLDRSNYEGLLSQLESVSERFAAQAAKTGRASIDA